MRLQRIFIVRLGLAGKIDFTGKVVDLKWICKIKCKIAVKWVKMSDKNGSSIFQGKFGTYTTEITVKMVVSSSFIFIIIKPH